MKQTMYYQEYTAQEINDVVWKIYSVTKDSECKDIKIVFTDKNTNKCITSIKCNPQDIKDYINIDLLKPSVSA